jgi:alpha-glucosidase
MKHLLALLFISIPIFAELEAKSKNSNWWKEAVIYQIYTRSYADSNGDGIGDLNGITAKLDYLADLGIDVIWLTPFYESPNADFGYDIQDYMTVGKEYGTLSDYDKLIREAASRGIYVINDLVLNHTSDRHPWFINSRSSRSSNKRDWYIWHDPNDDAPPNNWQSIFGGSAWKMDALTGQYYYHFFYAGQPDLNWRNPEVQDALSKVMRFWLDRGAAGFRLDVPDTLLEDPEMPDNPIGEGLNWVGDPNMLHKYNMDLPEVHGIMRQLRKVIDEYPAAILLGETGSPETIDELLVWYGESDELHLAMNFLYTNVRELSAEKFTRHVIESDKHTDIGWPVYLLSNHDRTRHLSRFADGLHNNAIAKQLAAMTLTLRGTPILYYGEEIGMTTQDPVRLEDVKDPIGRLFWPDFKGRDGSRTPMQWNSSQYSGFSQVKPWLSVPASAAKINVEIQLNDDQSILTFYRKLLAVRNSSSALRHGEWTHIPTQNHEVFAYLRHSLSESVLVILNMSASEHDLDLQELVMNSTFEVLLSNHDRRFITEALLNLQPYETVIARVLKAQ